MDTLRREYLRPSLKQMMTSSSSLLWRRLSSPLFSDSKLTSTSPWQRSPTKWTPGSIHRRACQSKHPSRHTQTHSGKGYNAARNKGADGGQRCGASPGRVAGHKCISLCVSSWIHPAASVFAVVFFQSVINFSNRCLSDFFEMF